MQYWLMKSEPHVYGLAHLKGEGVGQWDGVRNYQARNFMRAMAVGDRALFYHSNAGRATGVVGDMKIVQTAFPDPTQFEVGGKYYDAHATPSIPRWSAVKVRLVNEFGSVVDLATLRTMPELANCRLLARGNRLSVLPLTRSEYNAIIVQGKGRKRKV